MNGRVLSHVIGRSPASGHTPASASPYVSLTGRTLPVSGAFRPSVRSVDRRQRHSTSARPDAGGSTDRTLDPSVWSFPVRYPRRISSTGRVRSHVIGRSPASGHTPASASPYISLTGRTLPASGAFRPSVRSVDRRQRLCDQLVFTSNFFTLDPMCQPPRICIRRNRK